MPTVPPVFNKLMCFLLNGKEICLQAHSVCLFFNIYKMNLDIGFNGKCNVIVRSSIWLQYDFEWERERKRERERSNQYVYFKYILTAELPWINYLLKNILPLSHFKNFIVLSFK